MIDRDQVLLRVDVDGEGRAELLADPDAEYLGRHLVADPLSRNG
ncbi:MAG: hypothetical protein WBP34_17805 [Thermoanaerobaculia bacterium]